MTKEEKKLYMKEYLKKYREKNKEKAKEYAKNYYQSNKEKLNSVNKKYVRENKEKIKEYQRKYQKEYYHTHELYENCKDGYHRVYLLEDYNYVGCTGISLQKRFNGHKSEFGRIIKKDRYKVLFKSKDRDEALQVEAQYHDMGYEGRHIQNTYK